jgi:hypothetical protein
MLKRSSKDLNRNAASPVAEGREASPAKLPEQAMTRAILRAAIAQAGAQLPNPAAVALGRRGGLKGGKARAASLTPSQRSEIARKAAAARWDKKTGK